MIIHTMPGIEEFTPEFFSKASNEWMKNKIKKKDCTYVYKCTYVLSDGNPCTRQVKYHHTMVCWHHRNYK